MAIPAWATDLLPFVKGALGWSAASFVVENFIKPSKGRRRLAHVLAQEVGHDLQLMVLQLHQFELAPREIPADLHLADGVYKSVVDRIGDLSDCLTGELILFYERIASINRLTSELGGLADEIVLATRDPDKHGGMPVLEQKRERMHRAATVYKRSFVTAVEHGDKLIRMLRIAETFMGRVGYFFRSKPKLDVDQARRDVAAHRKRLDEQ